MLPVTVALPPVVKPSIAPAPLALATDTDTFDAIQDVRTDVIRVGLHFPNRCFLFLRERPSRMVKE